MFMVGCTIYNEDEKKELTTEQDTIMVVNVPETTHVQDVKNIDTLDEVIIVTALPLDTVVGFNPYVVPQIVQQEIPERIPMMVPYMTPQLEPVMIPKLRKNDMVMVNVTIITEMFVNGELINTTKSILVNPGVKIKK